MRFAALITSYGRATGTSMSSIPRTCAVNPEESAAATKPESAKVAEALIPVR